MVPPQARGGGGPPEPPSALSLSSPSSEVILEICPPASDSREGTAAWAEENLPYSGERVILATRGWCFLSAVLTAQERGARQGLLAAPQGRMHPGPVEAAAGGLTGSVSGLFACSAAQLLLAGQADTPQAA